MEMKTRKSRKINRKKTDDKDECIDDEHANEDEEVEEDKWIQDMKDSGEYKNDEKLNEKVENDVKEEYMFQDAYLINIDNKISSIDKQVKLSLGKIEKQK